MRTHMLLYAHAITRKHKHGNNKMEITFAQDTYDFVQTMYNELFESMVRLTNIETPTKSHLFDIAGKEYRMRAASDSLNITIKMSGPKTIQNMNGKQYQFIQAAMECRTSLVTLFDLMGPYTSDEDLRNYKQSYRPELMVTFFDGTELFDIPYTELDDFIELQTAA